MADIESKSTRLPCGCANRKYIMFTKGQLGVTEGAILTVATVALILAYKKGH